MDILKYPFNVGLIKLSVSAFIKFKELLEKSLTDLKSYIQDACTRTPDNNENANLFITLTELTPEKKRYTTDKKKVVTLTLYLVKSIYRLTPPFDFVTQIIEMCSYFR
ncbi:hypothetical protein Glove_406g52 [Diversispora epigaea]|uniref:Uncharacterized protein n=1 Tax=Diversispora epigaea TaxID=1348612 RepID=A0A397H2K8_9GLOM|nr:hypothetical protein Glove_406g52 [Diversispora epigaea]